MTTINSIVKLIQKRVADEFGISVIALRGKCRRATCYVPRWVSIVLVHETLGLGYKDTGALVGKDHSMVSYAIHKLDGLMQTNKFLRLRVGVLKEVVEAEVEKVFLNNSRRRNKGKKYNENVS